MKFRVVYQQPAANAHRSVRVVEQTTGREVGWMNRYLDQEYVSRLCAKKPSPFGVRTMQSRRTGARVSQSLKPITDVHSPTTAAMPAS